MRFLLTHTLEPGLSRERVLEIEKASQTDPDVKGYRSFLNFTERKGVCLFDAPDKEHLIRWLEKYELPYENIWVVELEGEHGEMIEIPTVATAGPTA